MKIEFFLPMIPPTVTQQEHKVNVVHGKPVIYDPPELKAAREKYMTVLAPHKPDEKLTGPIRLVTKWIWPFEDADVPSLDIVADSVFRWKTTKPDTDNMIKAFKDSLTRTGFWLDDAQVTSEVTEKVHGYHPGIYVMVEELGVEA